MDDRDEIIEALARYVRALEGRDGDAVAALFAPEGEFQVFSRFDREKYIAHSVHVIGRDALGVMMSANTLPVGQGMHYLTTDHVVDVTGEVASMQAQFMALASVATPRPESGWPKGAEVMQGKLTPVMIGYYDSLLRKIGGRWLFTRHHVKHSVPMTLPLES